jgi:aminocarboxymuconate-semialdehyde decarboxylase
MLPDFFWQATNEGDHPVGGIAPPPWSRESALSFLDDAGIDVAVTSISTPGVHTGDDTAVLGGTATKLIPRLAARVGLT